jgi:hypothetical protein
VRASVDEVSTMTEKEPFEHDAVMSSLTDLQRRLREAGEHEEGDEARGEVVGEGAAPTIVETEAPDTVAVTERDLTVVMTPAPEPERPGLERRERFAPVAQLPTASTGEDRVAVLSERLARLEDELSGVLGSLDSMRGRVAAEVTADVAGRMVAIQHETDERTVRIVSDRMDAVSTRVTGELEEQRKDLAGLLERRMVDMEVSLRDAILEVAAELEDGSEPPPPAG